ncbi:MAG: DUF3570 domain-containing protein [Sandaracinaceae bacterium]|nr:DUF3570 domain-containing protein [Myxococcales bacterium]MCB9657961.1 DUF3570 domain-containing protein [Sandaracinaceae bacterium]
MLLGLLAALASGASADDQPRDLTDAGATEAEAVALAALVDPPRFVLTEARLRMTYFNQQGRGFQSQADAAPGVPGRERLDVYQPVFSFGIDQGDDVHHTVVLPVDIVTSASADALDVISRASLVNEAVTLDVTTDWAATEDDGLSFRYGLHIEEPFRSGFLGAGYTRWLAQRNATISVNVQAIFDWFDPITPQGWDLGSTTRQTITTNVSGTQVLSPTTLGGVSYGLTYQTGTLAQTWNVVPVACADPSLCPPRAAELFPDSRLRHALSVWLAQRIPATGTTLRGHYRYYRDDFGLDAHTGRFEVFQDAGQHLRLRAHYRAHSQSAVSFWTTAVSPAAVDAFQPRTADSDLARFVAHEGGLGAVFLWPSRRDVRQGHFELELGYLVYGRSTGMRVHAGTLGWAFRR